MPATKAVIRDFDPPAYDPFDSDEVNFGGHLDPYLLIAELRAKAPVHTGSYRSKMGLPDAMMPDRQTFTIGASSSASFSRNSSRPGARRSLIRS